MIPYTTSWHVVARPGARPATVVPRRCPWGGRSPGGGGRCRGGAPPAPAGGTHRNGPRRWIAGARSPTSRSDAVRADLHAVLGGEAAQVVEFSLLHFDEE